LCFVTKRIQDLGDHLALKISAAVRVESDGHVPTFVT
jgi:hypothetical protein